MEQAEFDLPVLGFLQVSSAKQDKGKRIAGCLQE